MLFDNSTRLTFAACSSGSQPNGEMDDRIENWKSENLLTNNSTSPVFRRCNKAQTKRGQPHRAVWV
jgi:hypothetical protein